MSPATRFIAVLRLRFASSDATCTGYGAVVARYRPIISDIDNNVDVSKGYDGNAACRHGARTERAILIMSNQTYVAQL